MTKAAKGAVRLTAKQSRFVDEYLVDLNATQAAIRAGYSEKTARAQGQRLLTNVDIEAEIQRRMESRQERVGVTQDRVLLELARLGFSDMRELFDENGRLRPAHEMPDSVAGAVSSIKVVTRALPGEADEELESQPHGGALARNRNPKVEYIHEIKFWDKNSALEKIGKHLGMYTEKVDHTSSDGSMAPSVIILPPKQ